LSRRVNFATRLALPFLIISIASIQRSIRQAVFTDPYPLASHVRRFTLLVILLDNIIEELTPSQPASADDVLLLQLLDRGRIGTVVIDIDQARHPDCLNWLTLASRSVSQLLRHAWRWPESRSFVRLNRLPGREMLLAFFLDVRFIQPPASVSRLQVASTALVQFWTADLDPPPDVTGSDEQTSFDSHFTHLCHRERVPKISPHTPQDDVTRIISPFERIGCGDRHVSPYQIDPQRNQR
jgi:hypothetical protein